MRSWRSLRVVLDAEDGLGLVPQPLDRAVIQVDVRHLHIRGQRFRVHGEAVVLRRDLDLAGGKVLDRMVAPAMPELELIGVAAHRERQDLVAETNAEYRHVRVHELARVRDRVRQHGRIAGSVAQEDAVGPCGDEL